MVVGSRLRYFTNRLQEPSQIFKRLFIVIILEAIEKYFDQLTWRPREALQSSTVYSTVSIRYLKF